MMQWQATTVEAAVADCHGTRLVIFGCWPAMRQHSPPGAVQSV